MARLVSGHQVKVVEGAELSRLQRDFQGYGNGLVRLVPGNWLMPTAFAKIANKIHRTKFHNSDVVVMTPPKCGTTLLQEIIWTMKHNPNLDNPDGALDLNARSQMLEADMLFGGIPENPLKKTFESICPDGKEDDVLALQILEKMPNPRVIKTHLPFSLLNYDLLETTKVVFAVRDPKDMILSNYHHQKLLKAHNYKGTLDNFITYATDDQLMYSPFWEMLKEVWSKKEHANLHIVYFEDMKANPLEELKKLNEFLEISLSDDTLQKIANYTTFDEMKKRGETNSITEMYNLDVAKKDGGFFRKGLVGESLKVLTPAQQTKVDVWIKKNTIKHKIKIKYSLSKGYSKEKLIAVAKVISALNKPSPKPEVVNNAHKPEVVNRSKSTGTTRAMGNVVYQSPVSVAARKAAIESPSPPPADEAPIEEVDESPTEEVTDEVEKEVEGSTSVEQPVESSSEEEDSVLESHDVIDSKLEKEKESEQENYVTTVSTSEQENYDTTISTSEQENYETTVSTSEQENYDTTISTSEQKNYETTVSTSEQENYDTTISTSEQENYDTTISTSEQDNDQENNDTSISTADVNENATEESVNENESEEEAEEEHIYENLEAETANKLEEYYKKLRAATDCKSLLKKYLTKKVFNELRDKKTSLGATLVDVIQSGVENLDSGIGIYAPDAEAYTLFAPLFDPIIEDYHVGFSQSDRHPTKDFGDVNQFTNLDPEGEYVISTRVRCGRSMVGYAFNPCLTEKEYQEMETMVSNVLGKLQGELAGTYYPLTGMSKEVQQQLIDDHFLFKEGDRFLQSANACRFWPTGRGIYHNNDKTFLVWCNEEDHLRIISMQKGGDLGQIFRRLTTAVDEISKNIIFSRHERLGFLTFCPTNLGTTIRASVHIKLPKLAANREKLEEVAAKYNLQVRGTRGEHTEAEGGIYDISNKRRMGLTEFQAVMEMQNGILELIKLEKEM